MTPPMPDPKMPFDRQDDPEPEEVLPARVWGYPKDSTEQLLPVRVWGYPKSSADQFIIIDDFRLTNGPCPGLLRKSKIAALERGEAPRKVLTGYEQHQEKRILLSKIRSVVKWQRNSKLWWKNAELEIHHKYDKTRLIINDMEVREEVFDELQNRLGDGFKLKTSTGGRLFNVWLPMLLWLVLMSLTILGEVCGDLAEFIFEVIPSRLSSLGGLVWLYVFIVENIPFWVRCTLAVLLTFFIGWWIRKWLKDPPIRTTLTRKL